MLSLTDESPLILYVETATETLLFQTQIAAGLLKRAAIWLNSQTTQFFCPFFKVQHRVTAVLSLPLLVDVTKTLET